MLLTLVLPALASAAPITYALDHGSVSARVTLNGTTVASGTGTLEGFVRFDTDTGSPLDLSLASSDLLIQVPALPGAYGALDVDFLITPGAGFGSSTTGSNPYSILLGPLDIAFSSVAFDPTPPVTVPPLTASGVATLGQVPIVAHVTDGEMTLNISALEIAQVHFGPLEFKVFVEVAFVGNAVPEPTLAGLLAVALGALAIAARSR